MSTVNADRTRSIWTTDAEIAQAARRRAAELPSMSQGTACGGLSTREECAALAQAMAIRARVKLAQAYASLYDSWIAEDQIKRAEADGTQRGAQPPSGSGSSPARPLTAAQPSTSSPTGERGMRASRKSWPSLRRRPHGRKWRSS
jgi:hypothetical protein